MTTPTQQGLASCPSCGAAVRPGSDWCTLCFADLRPVPAPVMHTPPPVVASPVDPEGGVNAGEVKTIPCRTCGSAMNPLVDVCPACGTGLFDGLASDTKATLVLPVVGDVMRYSRNARMAGAAVLSTTFAAILVGVVAAVGNIF